jgi:hypothetical protein
MRHASVLHALATAGLFTGLFLGSSLISDASAATAGQALAVSVDDFNYIDMSNESADQTVVHEKRLRAFMTALRDDVTADRGFGLVPSYCARNCPTDGPALRDRLRAGRHADPDYRHRSQAKHAGAGGADCCHRYNSPARRVQKVLPVPR